MDISKQDRRVQEQISALVDGECASRELDLALTALKRKDCQDDWEIYHQIGDILNSEDLNIRLSADFTARLAARLASEPLPGKPSRKLSVPCSPKFACAIAATVAVAVILVAQFAGNNGAASYAPYLASHFNAANKGNQAKSGVVQTAHVRTDQAPMLRDPLIDSYLAAHERYSNSMYSAVEYETSPINQGSGK